MKRPKLHSIGIRHVKFGENVKIIQPVNLYDCSIGNNTFIGPFVEIQKDVTIGDKSQWRITQIGNNVLIGTNATILPIYICDNVVIGAGSVVTKDIKTSGTYAGNPSKLIRNI